VENIYALGRLAQVLESFSGPKLGVTYSTTLAEKERRKQAKEELRRKEQQQFEEYESARLQRR
jgi:hypothetical protein